MYQLKITLNGITPPILRRLLVSENITFYRLHHIIQITMGWTNSEIPGIKILTCHDQIYVEDRFIKEVRHIWDEEITNIHSLIPVKYESEETDDDDLSDIWIYEI